MRKLTNILFLVFLSVVLISGTAYAIGGVCYNCHTMHASQNGTLWGDGPNDYLLLWSCITCHSGATGSQVNLNSAPIVWRTSGGAPAGQGGSDTLAGGDFYWVVNTSDTMGHNVNGVIAADVAIGMTPPGWDNAQTDFNNDQIAFGAATWATQLNCAGAYGCHGNRSATDNDGGILGAHHGNVTGAVCGGPTCTQAVGPGTIGGSYRFLLYINGLEDSDWNWGELTNQHNEYYGTTYNDTGGAPAGNDKRTISFSCAECHGVFHTSATIGGTTSPWQRHPTDIALDRGAGTEYSNYNNGGGNPSVYDLEAPVARGTVPAAASADVYALQTDDDGAIVMCMSCHRAHGSPQPDILRWNYANIVAGGGDTGGCFTCHTTKD